ncbi:MAG: NADH-quinone oxidoreductase subunit J [Dehalococcoidia bacterium]|nr:NADH-quinone oxidoreductase subunit J [Dehalococcoidia bacterium]
MITDTGIVIAFYVIGASTVVSALMVAAVRNLIHAVLFLVITFTGVAGIYIVLSADFVAMAQVLIYAGAISVLLVFAVMLTPTGDRRNAETSFQAPALVLAGLLLAVVVFVIYDTDWRIASRGQFTTTASSLGRAFFSPYVVPFEVASVLLVAAMVGAIILTQDEDEEAGHAA